MFIRAENRETQPLPTKALTEDEFSVAQAKQLVADLFERKPHLYWIDFLTSVTVAYGATFLYLSATPFSATQVAAFVVAGLAIFRAGTFIHEIVHMGAGVMPGFRFVWNALFGVPLLMPSPFYRNHIDHHSKAHFGTPRDGEYLPLALGPASEVLRYLAQAPSLPLLVILRFFITPLSYLHPRLRALTIERASAFVSNPYYRMELRGPADLRGIVLSEWFCFAWLCVLVALTLNGVIAPQYLGLMYLLMTYTLGLNWIRNLAAHGYGNTGDPVSLSAQVCDSINITGQHWLTAPLFPVGLRYHATHHLFPGLPYHALGEAHRRLMRELPADSPYRATDYPTFLSAARNLWRGALAGHPAAADSRRRWRQA